jgi:hypothetical protein
MFESSKGRLALPHSLHQQARICDRKQLESWSENFGRSIIIMLENVGLR